MDNFHVWMYGIEKLCDNGDPEVQEIIAAMIDAVPLQMFETVCELYQSKGSNWLSMMEKGSPMYRQAGTRARARVEEQGLALQVAEPQTEGLCALDAALAKLRAKRSPQRIKSTL